MSIKVKHIYCQLLMDTCNIPWMLRRYMALMYHAISIVFLYGIEPAAHTWKLHYLLTWNQLTTYRITGIHQRKNPLPTYIQILDFKLNCICDPQTV